MRTFDVQALLDCCRSWQEARGLEAGQQVTHIDAKLVAAFIAPLTLRRLDSQGSDDAHVERVRTLLDDVGDWLDCKDAGADTNAILAQGRAVDAAWNVMGRRP